MTPVLSPNTQAILLLTAPLVAGRGTACADLLSPGEYKRLARHLREIQRQPADLVSPDAADILRACQPVVDADRLQRLLGRGFLLSQAIEQWQSRAIWVLSRADSDYPRRLKVRLREDTPAVLYGCGDLGVLNSGGLAVVGSRHVKDALLDQAMAVGRLAAQAGKTVVSGGAKGIDRAAMHGALEAGGTVCGVLSDSLEKAAMNREYRSALLNGKLALISPFDPNAGFNVGNAMQRNKVVYALSDVALVMSSDLNKGGTWAGATEQLNKFKQVPVYVRSTGEWSAGLDALRKNGAIPWPEPTDEAALSAMFSADGLNAQASDDAPFSFAPVEDPRNAELVEPVAPTLAQAGSKDRSPTVCDEPYSGQGTHTDGSAQSMVREPENTDYRSNSSAPASTVPAETLFAAVRALIREMHNSPMTESDVAAALDVSHAQAKAWLHRLVDEGALERRKGVRGYSVKRNGLFE